MTVFAAEDVVRREVHGIGPVDAIGIEQALVFDHPIDVDRLAGHTGARDDKAGRDQVCWLALDDHRRRAATGVITVAGFEHLVRRIGLDEDEERARQRLRQRNAHLP